MAPEGVQLLLDQVGNGRLAGARQPGQPQHGRPLPLLRRPRALVDVDRLPVDVPGCAQREPEHPGGDGAEREAVDEDEATGVPVLRVGVKRDRLVQLKVADADLVQLEVAGGDVLERVDVVLVLDRRDGRADRLGAAAQQVAAAAQQRLLGHADNGRLELVGQLRRVGGGHDHAAPAGVDVVGQRQRDRLAGHGGVEVAVEGDDPGHLALPAGGQDAHALAHLDRAAGHRAGVAPEVEVRPVHPLHREPKGRCPHPVGVDLDRLQVLEQRGPLVPAHLGAPGHDVVAAQRRDRDAGEVRQADRGGGRAVFGLDLAEALLGVAGQVHLVDRQRHVPDAHGRNDVAVPPGLRQDPLARVGQDHRAVRGRGAGRHVPGVLLVAWRIGHDEAPPRRREVAVGDVDRDALLALGRQPVEKKRVVELLALRAEPPRVGGKLLQVVIEEEPRLPEQPADQGRFAVVDAAAGDEAQQVDPLALPQPIVERRNRHQK